MILLAYDDYEDILVETGSIDDDVEVREPQYDDDDYGYDD